jgi:hypothetical protein
METKEEAKLIVDSLSTAFGDLFQVPDETIGHAIFGRVNSGDARNSAEVQKLVDEVTEVISNHWEDVAGHWKHIDLDEDSLRARIVKGYRAARVSTTGNQVPWI